MKDRNLNIAVFILILLSVNQFFVHSLPLSENKTNIVFQRKLHFLQNV